MLQMFCFLCRKGIAFYFTNGLLAMLQNDCFLFTNGLLSMPRVDYFLCHKLIAFFFTNGLPSVPQRFAFYSATGILFVLQVDIFLLCRKESIYCKAAVLVRNWDTVVCCNLYIDGTKLTIEFDILHIVTNVLWAFRNVPPSAGKVSIRPGIKFFLKNLHALFGVVLQSDRMRLEREKADLLAKNRNLVTNGERSEVAAILYHKYSSVVFISHYKIQWNMRDAHK